MEPVFSVTLRRLRQVHNRSISERECTVLVSLVCFGHRLEHGRRESPRWTPVMLTEHSKEERIA